MKVSQDYKKIGQRNLLKIAKLTTLMTLGETAEMSLVGDTLLRLKLNDSDDREFRGRLWSPSYSMWSPWITFDLKATPEGIEVFQDEGPWSLISWGDLKDVRRVDDAS